MATFLNDPAYIENDFECQLRLVGWLVGLVRFVCQCLTSARLRPARVELKAGHAGAAAGACQATNIKVSRIFKNQLSLESAELSRPLVG